MKRGRIRLLLPLLVLACTTGCGGAADKVRLLHVGPFERHGWAGGDLTLVAENASAHRIRLREAAVRFYYDGSYAGTAVLRGEVLAPRRSVDTLRSRWKFDIPDPAAAYIVSERIERGETNGVSVEAEGRIGMGWFNRRISVPRMPLSEFLRTFESRQPANE